MNTDLHKRLEEDFIKWLNEHRNETTIRNYEDETLAHFSFNAGAELGYKEAIAQAKEWLIGHINTDVECDENGEPLAISYIEGRKLAIEMATEFEAEMNKLLEEKK